MIVEAARLRVVRRRLRRPYRLSFATIESITSHLVEIRLRGGGQALGEAVALPGYGHETDASIRAALDRLLPHLPGRTVEEARWESIDRLRSDPFATSAVMTALDLASGAFTIPSEIRVPVVAALGTDRSEEIPACLDGLVSSGIRTLKVKVGRDVESDIRVAAAVLDALPPQMTVRFDANGGYGREAARRFLSSLDHPASSRIQFVEQPLDRGDWEGFDDIVHEAPVPLMLDEPILGLRDVDRAEASGARFVKLKLFKHHGVLGLLAIARRAVDLGLGVVLGNGVASDVCNLVEGALLAAEPEVFTTGGECVGFARLRHCLLAEPPRLRDGYLEWRAPAADSVWKLGDDLVTAAT